jgi:hypothetical protein
MVEFKSGLYDGFCQGIGYGKMRNLGIDWDFDIALGNITAVKLSSLVKQLGNIDGRLNADLHYSYHDRGILKGRISVKDGALRDFEFFKWLAESFGMESLRRIKFKSVKSDFYRDDTVYRLENINLKSFPVLMDGYYGVEDAMVSSKMSLAISRQLLAKSPKFKPLVRLLGSQLHYFTFDFQLSGLVESMNFKWLDSEFKRRLRNKIPNFVERGIEQKVEAIIYK